jgi:ABC-2 type transport system permease protein
MLARIVNLAAKDFIQITRDRILISFTVLGMAFQLVLLALATSREVAELQMGILDLDKSQQSRTLITALDNTKELYQSQVFDSVEQADDLLDGGEIVVAVIIPQGFASDLAAGRQPQVQILADGSNVWAGSTVVRVTEGVISRFGQAVVLEKVGHSTPALLELRPKIHFNEDLSGKYFAIPAELGLIVYMVTLLVSAAGIARERELGTLEQLMVTPLRRVELIVGKAIPAVVVAFVDFLMMLAITVWVFHIPLRGSLFLLMALTLLFIVSELGFGLVISAISANQQQTVLFVFMLGILDMAFSGYLVAVENMPSALRFASNFSPIRHYLIIVRGIMLKGATLSSLWPQTLALVALGTGILTLTFRSLHKRLD